MCHPLQPGIAAKQSPGEKQGTCRADPTAGVGNVPTFNPHGATVQKKITCSLPTRHLQPVFQACKFALRCWKTTSYLGKHGFPHSCEIPLSHCPRNTGLERGVGVGPDPMPQSVGGPGGHRGTFGTTNLKSGSHGADLGAHRAFSERDCTAHKANNQQDLGCLRAKTPTLGGGCCRPCCKPKTLHYLVRHSYVPNPLDSFTCCPLWTLDHSSHL